MHSDESPEARLVRATHGLKSSEPDPSYIAELAAELSSHYGREGLIELYGRFINGTGYLDHLVRRVIWHGLALSCGPGLTVEPGVGFKHPETFSIGNAVFIGANTYVQGRYDGRCEIGDHVWIGPSSFLDARDLVIEDHVGWGPGARVLGSTHTGLPIDVPIIQTDLLIQPVRIRAWADVGTNAVVLPGVTVGKGAIVGAGAVVDKDVRPFAVVAGVPARFLHWRDGYSPPDSTHTDST